MPRRLLLPLCVAAVTAGSPPLRADAQTPPAPATQNESAWNILGRSLEDRVIEYRQFGEGRRQVLVVGPLEGDETAGLDLVESLAEHLERFPRRTSGARVTLVRDPNPDGRLRRTAGNARGVLLNRNFPTQGWRKLPAGNLWISGREPESEPEVRALLDLVEDVRPDCVILLAATRRLPTVAYTGPAAALVREFAKSSGLRPGAINVAAEQGSFAVFTGADRKLPTLVVYVPAGMRRDVLWTNYKRGLLAAIGGDEDNRDLVTPSPVTQPEAGQEVARQTSSQSRQSQTLLANSKRQPDGTRPKSTANQPLILAADELESAGELVPVVPVRRQFGAASALPPSKPAIGARSAPSPRPNLRANAPGAFPPAVLARPSTNRLQPVPLSTLRPKALSAPMIPRVQRLPPVDRAAPPVSPPMTPQPIPLYPETGL